MKSKAIIFDCDGTLVDSETLGNEVLVETLAEYGVTMSLAEALAAFRGGMLADCLSMVEQRFGLTVPESFTPRFRARMSAAFRERLQPVDGALDLVRSLRQRLCVASNGPREKMELTLSITGLMPFFQGSIFSGYDIGAWKPDPGLFWHAARTLGYAPESCVVVEDSHPGIQAGLAAGMEVIAFQPHEVDPRIPANVRLIRHLSELKSLLA